eukprot:7419165-Pyramimonas_sp.AAC.1
MRALHQRLDAAASAHWEQLWTRHEIRKWLRAWPEKDAMPAHTKRRCQGSPALCLKRFRRSGEGGRPPAQDTLHSRKSP